MGSPKDSNGASTTTAAAPPGGKPPQVTFRRAPKRSELIAQELASYIVDSRLEPGTPLASEREMSDAMGVGRTTLREALRLLETRGVLTIKAGVGGGPVVRRPRPSDLREALTLILQFEETQLIEVLEARRWLEVAVSRLAATLVTAQTIEELRRINRELGAASDDLDTALERNQQFHRLICEASGNVVLRVFLESMMSISDGKAMGITYGRRQIKHIAVAHERIIAALATGDVEAAGEAMNDHLIESYRYWRRRYGNVVSQTVRWMQ
jgi:DNA-binding FadR family transcriptional regulator